MKLKIMPNFIIIILNYNKNRLNFLVIITLAIEQMIYKLKIKIKNTKINKTLN